MSTDTRPTTTLATRREHAGPDIWCEDLVRIYSTEGVEVQPVKIVDRREKVFRNKSIIMCYYA